MTSQRLKVGDIIEIPLPNNKKTYAQFLAKDKWGDIIQVFDLIINSDKKINIETLINTPLRFDPILTTVKLGLKLSEMSKYLDDIKTSKIVLPSSLVKMLLTNHESCSWKIVGNLKVTNLIRPKFIWKDGGPQTNKLKTKWYLYDGKESIEIGQSLPKEFKKHEYMTTYSPGSVIERIVTGKNPDEYVINHG